MIYGVGTDVLFVSRVKKVLQSSGMRFVERVCSGEEIASFGLVSVEKILNSDKKLLKLGKIFSLKEAVSKSFGTGIAGGVSFQDMTLINDEKGKPEVVLSDKLKKILNDLILAKFSDKFETEKEVGFNLEVSISDESDLIQTFAILEILNI